jgi:hypothetical protein
MIKITVETINKVFGLPSRDHVEDALKDNSKVSRLILDELKVNGHQSIRILKEKGVDFKIDLS